MKAYWIIIEINVNVIFNVTNVASVNHQIKNSN